MIQSIELKNFQSHEKTLLKLSDGINAIVGPSDNGKSAVLRGLYWARYNQPAGDSFVSHWARNGKGKQKDPSAVTVIKDQKQISREKTPDFNGYRMEDQDDLGAIGRGNVPEEIEIFFNMSEVNIQKQMDSPFLLGGSPPEIARFFNGLVNLSVIDKYMSAIDSKKRTLNADIRALEKEIEKEEAELQELSWIESAEKLYSKLFKISTRKANKVGVLDILRHSLEKYTAAMEKVHSAGNVIKMEKLSKKLEKLMGDVIATEGIHRELTQSLSKYRQSEKQLKRLDVLPAVEDLLTELEQVSQKKVALQETRQKLNWNLQDWKRQTIVLKISEKIPVAEKLLSKLKKLRERQANQNDYRVKLMGSLRQYRTAHETQEQSEKDLKNLKAELPDLCPLCKQTLKGVPHVR